MATYSSGGDDRRAVPAVWASWINLLLGLWMIISPFVLRYTVSATAQWNGVVVGVLIAIAGLSATQSYSSAASWWNVIFGIWLFLSPWILQFGQLQNASTNDMIVGAAVVILGLIAGLTKASSPSGTVAANRGA
jgi:hypothetical protein